MMTGYTDIFTAFRIGHVKLRNRIVVPPMVQIRPIISAEGMAWYRRLASGGAGLVIVEATGVPRFGEDLTPDTLRPLVGAIHSEGAAAAIQLFPIRFGEQTNPDDWSLDQIQAMVDQYGEAATICLEAGFDGVEPHGAHGFVLNQFFMPDKSHRTDECGNTLENRCRPAARIVERIRQAAGEDLLVFYRHTPAGIEYTIDDSLYLAQHLIDAGLDVLDISPAQNASVADMAAPFKARFDIPVIAVNGMDDPEQAGKALREGKCDLIAVGRQMIADAQWPAKVREGKLANIRECKKCDEGCHGSIRAGKPVECVQWAEDELAPWVR